MARLVPTRWLLGGPGWRGPAPNRGALRYDARTDATQKLLVRGLRAVGCSVQPLQQQAGGVPDLLVGVPACWVDGSPSPGLGNALIEVKTTYVRTRRLRNGAVRRYQEPERLNKKQVAWHGAWRGQTAVAYSLREALRIVGAEHLLPIALAAIDGT